MLRWLIHVWGKRTYWLLSYAQHFAWQNMLALVRMSFENSMYLKKTKKTWSILKQNYLKFTRSFHSYRLNLTACFHLVVMREQQDPLLRCHCKVLIAHKTSNTCRIEKSKNQKIGLEAVLCLLMRFGTWAFIRAKRVQRKKAHLKRVLQEWAQKPGNVFASSGAIILKWVFFFSFLWVFG